MKKSCLLFGFLLACFIFMAAGCSNDDSNSSGGIPGSSGGADTVNEELSKDKDMHKIFLLSDIHVMGPGILQNKDNPKYKEYLKTDTKMLEQSTTVLEKLIDLAIAQKSGLVLIAGDLTKDGEYVSHEYVAKSLERLRQNGIRTLVIPGNHDINNPEGVIYKDGSQTEAARRTTPQEFEAFYRNFGYNKDTKDYLNYSRDPVSLSYCCEPFAGLYLVCLDSNSYDQITESDTRNKTAGRLRDETVTWMMPLVDAAKKAGKQVVVMMHHNLIEHFDNQNKLESMFQVKDSKLRMENFFEHDIELVLTGHVHSRDIATTYNGDKSADTTKKLTEITCASPISYPCAYNVLTLNEGLTEFKVKSDIIESITGIADYQAQARQNHQVNAELIKWALDEKWSTIVQFIPFMAATGINYDFSKGTAAIAQDIDECLGDVATRLERLFFNGCENKNTEADIKKDSLPEDINTALDKLAAKLITDKEGDTEEVKTQHANLRKSLIQLIKGYMDFDKVINSVVNDITAYGESDKQDQTDDIETTIKLKRVAAN